MLEDLIKKILTDKGLIPPKITQPVYEEMLKDGVEKLEDKLKFVMFEAIPEKDMPEFDRLIDQDDAGKLQAFISRTIPNLQELQAQAILDFKDNYF